MPGANEEQNTSVQEGQEASQTGAGDQGQADNTNENTEQESAFKSVEDAMAEIKRLRKESADRRTKNKALEERLGSMEGTMTKLKDAFGLGESEESPEEMAQQLQHQNALLQTELGITQLAREHGIPKEHDDYFRFLFHERLAALEEGEELDEESYSEIIQKVMGLSGKAAGNSTGLSDQGAPNPGAPGGVDVQRFVKMTTSEKAELYQRNQGLYQKLMSEAAEKRLLK